MKKNLENLKSKIKTILSPIFTNTLKLKKQYVTTFASIAGVSLVSIILLIFFSPVYSIIWLTLSSFCFLYIKNYKPIYKIWFITITIWYLIFTTTLANIPIIIGFDHTRVVFLYLMHNDVLFANLCFQTVVILDILSSKLGFPLYIPAFVNLIKLIIDYLFQPPSPTACSEKEDVNRSHQKSEKQSSSLWDRYKFWKPSPTRGDDFINDSEQCVDLAKKYKRMEKTINRNVYSDSQTNGDRTVEQLSVKVPVFGHFTTCFGREANSAEKKEYNKDKKNSK